MMARFIDGCGVVERKVDDRLPPRWQVYDPERYGDEAVLFVRHRGRWDGVPVYLASCDCDRLRTERDKLRADVEAAAGEHLVPIPEPGSDMARLLIANRILRQWIDDLQADCYINCVYCGHRYGPDSEVPASMADVLKAHIEQCPEHPLSAAMETNSRLRTGRDHLRVWLSSACDLLRAAVDSSGECPGCLYHAGAHGEECDVAVLCYLAAANVETAKERT